LLVGPDLHDSSGCEPSLHPLKKLSLRKKSRLKRLKEEGVGGGQCRLAPGGGMSSKELQKTGKLSSGWGCADKVTMETEMGEKDIAVRAADKSDVE